MHVCVACVIMYPMFICSHGPVLVYTHHWKSIVLCVFCFCRIELEKQIWKASMKVTLGFNLCFKLLLHLTHNVSMHVYRHCIFQPSTINLFLMHAYYFTLLNPILSLRVAFDEERRIDMYY